MYSHGRSYEERGEGGGGWTVLCIVFKVKKKHQERSYSIIIVFI